MIFNRMAGIHKKFLTTLALVALVCGCATSPKMQVVQAGDNHLTKTQLVAEMSKLDMAQQEIDSKKGVTGTNVAAALFWLPGLAYTYYDAGEATRMISERRSHLTALYNQKLDDERKSSKRRS